MDRSSAKSAVPPTSRPTYPSTTSSRNTSTVRKSELTGTYRLDTTKSENTDQILSETGVSGSQRTDLQKKLEAPDQIAIDIRGDQVTLASSTASPVRIVADGTDRNKTGPHGGSIRTRATLRGQELTIASLGGQTDCTV